MQHSLSGWLRTFCLLALIAILALLPLLVFPISPVLLHTLALPLALLSGVAVAVAITLQRSQNAELRKAEESERELRLREEGYRIAAQQSGKQVLRYYIDTQTADWDHLSTTVHASVGFLFGKPRTFANTQIIVPASKRAYLDFFDRIERGESPTTTCIEVVLDQVHRFLRIDATTIFDQAQKPIQAIITYYDTTEQRQKELAYEKWKQERAALPLDQTALFEWNLTQNIFELDGGELLTPLRSLPHQAFDPWSEAYGETTVFLTDRTAFQSLVHRERLIGAFHEGHNRHELDYRETCDDGETRWMRLEIQLVQYPDTDEIKAFLTLRDINAQKRAEIEAKARANTDALTGALNRQAFTEALMAALAAQATRSAFLMLDLDGFKTVNDTFGHSVGDQTLIDVVSKIRSILRRDDLIGRIGGDEFAVFLLNAPSDAVVGKKCVELCKALRRDFGDGIVLSASIGVAIAERDGQTFTELYENADHALYRAKENGKDGYVFFSVSLMQSTPYRLTPPSSAEPARDTPKKRVLVTDDARIDRMMLANMLRQEYTVLEACNAGEAMALMRKYGAGVAACLTDLIMPDMSGFDMLRAMREDATLRGIPVIVISAAEEPVTRLQAIRLGAAEFLNKPVEQKLLLARLETAIAKGESERLRLQNSFLLLQSDEEARYRYILESSGTVVIDYDVANDHYTYDALVSRYIAGSFDQRPLPQILREDSLADESDVSAMEALFSSLLAQAIPAHGQLTVRLLAASGERRRFRMSVLHRKDDAGLSDRLLLTLLDIDDELSSREQLLRLAERDELTGLYNRAAFLHRLQALCAEQPSCAYVCAYFDLDSFRTINELFGHVSGDNLLTYISQWLMTALGSDGLYAHISGDYFAAFFPNKPECWAHMLAEREAHLAANPLGFPLVSRIGFYVVDDPLLPPGEILERAVLTQKSIKGKPGQLRAFYDEALRKTLRDEQELIASMRGALARHEFFVELQPQYALNNGQLWGAEVLVRWRHPTRGLLMPGSFIPIFERNGFITELDAYVWAEACTIQRACLDAGIAPLPISVNVSRMNFYHTSLCDQLEGLLNRYGLPQNLIALEITENLYIDHPDLFIRVIAMLKSHGFCVELDDFGSGYSSLSALKDIPVDVLKLDLRFLSGAQNRQRGSRILASVVRMAQALNLTIVAEGVETKDQAHFLRELGVDYVQGFYYSRPVPVEQYLALLKKRPDYKKES